MLIAATSHRGRGEDNGERGEWECSTATLSKHRVTSLAVYRSGNKTLNWIYSCCIDNKLAAELQ